MKRTLLNLGSARHGTILPLRHNTQSHLAQPAQKKFKACSSGALLFTAGFCSAAKRSKLSADRRPLSSLMAS